MAKKRRYLLAAPLLIVLAAGGYYLRLSSIRKQRALPQSNLKTYDFTLDRSPSNDTIEREARRLAGADAVDCGRTLMTYGVGNYEWRAEREEADSCAVETFKTRRPFVLIHDDNFFEHPRGFSQHTGSIMREAFVLTPQRKLLRLHARSNPKAAGTASFDEVIVRQPIRQLFLSRKLDYMGIPQIQWK